MTTPSDELRAKRHLDHAAYVSLLRRAEEWEDKDWERATKFERHAVNAAVDLRDALAALEREPVAYSSNTADFDTLWQAADPAEKAAPVYTEDEVRKLAWLWWSRGQKGEPVAEGEVAKLIRRARKLVARQPDDITQLLADALEREHVARLTAEHCLFQMQEASKDLMAQLTERDRRIAELEADITATRGSFNGAQQVLKERYQRQVNEQVATLTERLALLEQQSGDLGMMMRRVLAHPDSKNVKAQAWGLLQRFGLEGSILREAALDAAAPAGEKEDE